MAPSKSPLDIEKKRDHATDQSSGNEGESLEGGASYREFRQIIYRRKKLIAISAITITSAITGQLIFQRLLHPVYEGTFSLLIKDPINNSSSSNNSQSANTNFQNLALNSISNDLPTLISVMRSPLILSPIAESFDLSELQLAGRITITPVGEGRTGQGAGILNVKLKGKDPDNDKILLDQLADVYLEIAQRQRQQSLRDGLAFLDQQKPALEAKSTALLTELENFRKQNLLIDASTEALKIEANLSSTEQSLLSLQNTRRNLEQVRKQVAAGNLNSFDFQGSIISGGGASTSGTTETAGSSLSGSIGISGIDSTLEEELTTLKEALYEARSIYQPGSFAMKSLEQKKAALEPLLLASQLRALDTALQVNSNQINSTKLELKNLIQNFLRQPALMKGFEELQSRLALVQGNLAALTSTQESFRLELAQNSVPWRLLSPPRMNPIPIEPSVKTGFLKAILIGVASGLGIGVLRDRIDHVFHTPEEVDNGLKLPLLGHIPYLKLFQNIREEKRSLLSEIDANAMNSSPNYQAENKHNASQQSYEHFSYQEAFRNLFTSIRFLNNDQPIKTIALTSSVPAEGKSLVTILLAKTLSEMGQRVLLIDADLRKPQIHTRLGINNLIGLSNILANHNENWQDALQSVPNYSNWFTITAGLRPPDATQLLSSKRMHEFVEDITESGKFDLILFDTSPILGLADTALVAEKCNGVVLLVSLNRVDRSLPKQAANRIFSSGAELLGIVTNGFGASTPSNAYGYNRKYGFRKYSYGNYGYGAYDPTATYADYANTEDENAADQENSVRNKRRNWLKSLSNQAERLMRWIDG